MDKDAALIRLCHLTSEVMARRFDYHEPADCFCSHSFRHETTSEAVIEFIENAVRKELKEYEEKKATQHSS